MKKVILFSIIMTLSSFIATLFSQTNCKVLNPSISDSYTGSCKQGLADGKGEAFGVDQYKGDFKKGLPNGKGTYIWQSGEKYEGSWKNGMKDGEGKYTFKYEGRDSLLTGIWKEDKYVGIKSVPPYVIQYMSGILRVSCVRTGDQPLYVRYRFARGGGSTENTNDISGLLLQGSSGNESQTGNFLGNENVTFPFEGKVKFTAPGLLSSQNAANAITLNYELRFVINQSGAWTVTINY